MRNFQTPVLPAAEWVAPYDPKTQTASFTLPDSDVGRAAQHFQANANRDDTGVKDFAHHVHLETQTGHLDLDFDQHRNEFVYTATTEQPAALGSLAYAATLLLQTNPSLHPLEKSMVVQDYEGSIGIHKNQFELFRRFDDFVIHEDGSLLVVNKPPYVSSHWDQITHVGVTEIAQARRDNVRHAHRLDRPTSGILLLAKNYPAHASLDAQFAGETQRPEKKYLAKVEGEITDDHDLHYFIDATERPVKISTDPTAGKLAQTAIRPIISYKTPEGLQQTLVHAIPRHGRTHQIRASLAEAGYPIVNDVRYGAKSSPEKGRVQLHAEAITITHPNTQQRISFQAPVPGDFLQGLSKEAQEILLSNG